MENLGENVIKLIKEVKKMEYTKEKIEKKIKENAKTQIMIQNALKKASNHSEKLVEIFMEMLLKVVEKQKQNVEYLNKLLCNSKGVESVENSKTQ